MINNGVSEDNSKKTNPRNCSVCGAPKVTVVVSGTGWCNQTKKRVCSVDPAHSVKKEEKTKSMFN